jgi:transposase-like protein
VQTYSESFKRKIVQQLLLPGAPSANTLAKKINVPQSTISRWVRLLGTVPRVSNDNEGSAGRPRRPEDWTAEERLRAVTEAGRLEGEELGKFLRREGLHEEMLNEWRQAVLDALQPARRSSGNRAERRRIERLEKQLAKKEKALAAANAVVALQKKVHALLGDEDDDTNKESDE